MYDGTFNYFDPVWMFSTYVEYNGRSIVRYNSTALFGIWRGMFLYERSDGAAVVSYECLRKEGLPDRHNDFGISFGHISHSRDALVREYTRFNTYNQWKKWYYSSIRRKLVDANVDKKFAELLAEPWGVLGKLGVGCVYGNTTTVLGFNKVTLKDRYSEEGYRCYKAAWNKIC